MTPPRSCPSKQDGSLIRFAAKRSQPEPTVSGLDRAEQEQEQRRLDEQVREHFPDGGVQRVDLLQHGDGPSVEPGDLLVQVFTKETGGNRSRPAWHRDHETMIRELQRE